MGRVTLQAKQIPCYFLKLRCIAIMHTSEFIYDLYIISFNSKFLKMTKIYKTLRTTRAALSVLLMGIFMLAVQAGYGQATVDTDKYDYLPGETVKITGVRWQPGETVSLLIEHLTFDHPDELLDVIADEYGNILNTVYVIDPKDLGESFLLTATGLSSGEIATTTFTDGGGAYIIKWFAADPAVNKAPYLPTYDKIPSSELPCTAVGGRDSNPLTDAVAYTPGTLQLDAVTSLAPKDMALCQVVPFYLVVDVSGSTSPENGTITVKPYWLTKTTSGGDFGFDPTSGLYCAFVDYSDAGTTDPNGNAKVDFYGFNIDKTGTNDEQIVGNVQISGLEDGDHIIVELWVALKCIIPTGSTGNVQTGLISAQTVAALPDVINTGNQTVPLLRVQEFFSSKADLVVSKTANPVCFGENIFYNITEIGRAHV